MMDLIDRRVLGALEFVEANTGLPVARPLQVSCDEATFFRNRRGLYVITAAAGLAAATRAFEAQPAITPRDLTVRVEDPDGGFLPRQSTVPLPRDPDPANGENPDSLFRPQAITLFPAPAAAAAPGWAVIHATVRSQATGDPLGGALLRVLQNGGTVLARGLTAWQGRVRGEAFVAVPGLPVTTSGDDGDDDGLVIVDELALTLEAIVDPAFNPDTGWPDPADLEARMGTLATGSAAVGLAAGRTIAATVEVVI